MAKKNFISTFICAVHSQSQVPDAYLRYTYLCRRPIVLEVKLARTLFADPSPNVFEDTSTYWGHFDAQSECCSTIMEGRNNDKSSDTSSHW